MEQGNELKRLSFLGQKVNVSRDSFQATGTVYYFSETVLVLEKNGNFDIINLNPF
jgi:hypothetical protein